MADSSICKNKFYSNNKAKVLFPALKRNVNANVAPTNTTKKNTPDQQYRAQQASLLLSSSRGEEIDFLPPNNNGAGLDESLNSSTNSNILNSSTVDGVGNREVLRLHHVRSLRSKKIKKLQYNEKKKLKRRKIVEEKNQLKKEKDCREIKTLTIKLDNAKSKLCHLEKIRSKQMNTTYNFKYSNLTRKDLSGAKDYLLKQLPSYPPSILSNALVCYDDTIIGKSTFGTVTLGKLPHITSEFVAVKTVSLQHSNVTEIKAEVKVLHALSGHANFPYCYGLVDNNKIILQFIGDFKNGEPIITTVQSNMGKKVVTPTEWCIICFKLCQAIKFLHSLSILHNDIKANNVILRNKIEVKLIDFGKATSTKKPSVYNLSAKSQIKYNLKHRYLAHELRNGKNIKQSVLTDYYSVGYLIKYIGYYEKLDFLHELGRKLKAIDIQTRLSLDAASDILNTEIPKL